MKRITQCVSKTPYNTKKEAQEVIEYLKTQDVYLKVYKCPICGKYHLTGK